MKQTVLYKKELEYFFVEESYGGNQDLFPDVTMRDGGCGAIAACESCIYFARTNDMRNLYPHPIQEISWNEYHEFAYIMKHYLCPRPNGIDTLELFMEGFGEYLKDMLKHKNEKGPLEDYIWHWFILAGYEETGNDLLVKAVSYGEYKWFSLKEMWDTGYDKKGGMILYHI